MPWQPISEPDLNLLLADAVAALPGDLRNQFHAGREAPRLMPCERGLGLEYVFLVFRHKDRFVIYDDVEEEFAVVLGSDVYDGVLRAWVPAGDLEWALKAAVF